MVAKVSHSLEEESSQEQSPYCFNLALKTYLQFSSLVLVA